MAEDIPFSLNYSSLDYEVGVAFDDLYRDFSQNEFKKKLVSKILAYKNKKHSFLHLTPFLDRLELITKITDQDSFYKNCTIIPRSINEYTENLAHRMDIAIDRHCRFLFLKNMQRFSSNINLSTRDFNFLKDAVPFFISGENQSEVAAFLKHYKPNTIEHEKISDIFISQYIEYAIKPTSAILINLKINSALNLFLQSNPHLDKNATSLFQDEFQKMIKDSQLLTEKNDFSQAKEKIIEALTFYSKNKKFIDDKKAWIGTVLSAKALFYKGRDTDAQDIFILSRAVAPTEDFSEATFYLLWPHLVNKDYTAMKKVIEKNNLEKLFDSYDSKLKFWIAYAALKTGDSKKAEIYFEKIVSTAPYSFYSIISLKELALLQKKASEQEILAKLIGENPVADFSMDVASDELKNSLRRMAVWNKIGNERFATLEQRFLQNMEKKNIFKDENFSEKISKNEAKEFIILNLVRLLHSQKKFITSFKIFQDSLGENSFALNYRLIKYIFPLGYMDLITKHSSNLDPILTISLIRQESAFNPLAKSPVGARGLMQLMPATAKRLNRKIKPQHLNDPKTNVTLGTKYLKQLLVRFDGNLIYALASYNAGENRIERWRKDIFRNDDPLATIESIPFEETRNYIKLIYRNKFFYSLLSNKTILMTPLEESFKVGTAEKK